MRFFLPACLALLVTAHPATTQPIGVRSAALLGSDGGDGVETIGAYSIAAIPSDAVVVTGNVPADDWLNVVNQPVTVFEAFTGAGMLDDGFANVPRAQTGDVVIELTFAAGVVNAPGDDLLLVDSFTVTPYGMSTSYDGFAAETFISSTAFLDSGEDRTYYYGKTVGPFATDIMVAPIDLTDLGVPAGKTVTKVRLRMYQGAESDPIGLGALTVEASVSNRNAGANPLSYSASAPVLGSVWTASVDLSTSGHTFAFVQGNAAPGTTMLRAGQVLLVSGARVFKLPMKPGPVANWSASIPNEASLAGRRLFTQAVHAFGVKPFALSNAQDLVVGF